MLFKNSQIDFWFMPLLFFDEVLYADLQEDNRLVRCSFTYRPVVER